MSSPSNTTKLLDYHDFLFAFVDSKLPKNLRRHVGVSDVVQSVFCVAGAKLSQFRGDSEMEFRGWLVRIAERKMIDAMRRHRLRHCPPEVRPIRSVVARDMVDPRTPEHDLSAQEQVRGLMTAIESLPDELRRVVIARHVHQMTFDTMAVEFSVPVSTCRRRWLEALDTLGLRLKDLL